MALNQKGLSAVKEHFHYSRALLQPITSYLYDPGLGPKFKESFTL
jgi:hypothetical protein